MSRLGKKPIQIPKDVSIILEDNILKVTGPKGSLQQVVSHPISF